MGYKIMTLRKLLLFTGSASHNLHSGRSSAAVIHNKIIINNKISASFESSLRHSPSKASTRSNHKELVQKIFLHLLRVTNCRILSVTNVTLVRNNE